ncbi:MAG TPA: hypothetical protein VGA67_04630 [Candidatus Dojkabacteria bacterium]|jgi:hypothetical protein
MAKTQGQKKIKNRLNELFSNESFKKEFDEISQIKDLKERNNMGRKLAGKYSIEYTIRTPLAKLLGHPAFNKDVTKNLDVCKTINQFSDNQDFISYLDYLDQLDSIKRQEGAKEWLLNNRKKLFPVHLAISPYASKRDVLDFINKNWNSMKAQLNQYDEKIPQYRAKKYTERDDFIWENRKLPAEEISRLVEEKFPEQNLTYSDINSILYNLRKRRLSKQV